MSRPRTAVFWTLAALVWWAGCWSPRPPAPAPMPPPAPLPTPGPAPAPGSTAAQLWAAHNRARATRGLKALALNPLLQALAQSHADAEAKRGVMSHDLAGDGPFGSRLNASGYRYQSAGENVAAGQATVDAVMASWLASPGHRANILGRYTEGGFASAAGADGTVYWSADFGLPPAAGLGSGVAAGPPTIRLGTDPP